MKTQPLGYGGQLIADVFRVLYEEDRDEKWIEAAEVCAIRLTFGKVTDAGLPDLIADTVARLKEEQ